MRTWIIVGLSLPPLAVCVLTMAQEPCTITVQPGESIQAAIDAAPEGAVICLAEGEWEENLVIEKPLTLRGQGHPNSTIRGKTEWVPTVQIDSPEPLVVNLQGLAIVDGLESRVVAVGGKVQVNLVGVAVGDGDMGGVYVRDSARVSLMTSIVQRNRGDGIILLESAQLTMTRSSVFNSETGISMTGSSKAVVLESVVHENRSRGVILWDTSEIRLIESKVYLNGGNGVSVLDSASASIMAGVIEDNAGLAGVSALDDAHLTIAGSRITGNGWCGVYIVDRADVNLDRNTIASNVAFGVCLYERPCFDVDDTFSGRVSGGGNTIPGPGAEGGNGESAVCPSGLSFLTTTEGGELDRRE